MWHSGVNIIICDLLRIMAYKNIKNIKTFGHSEFSFLGWIWVVTMVWIIRFVAVVEEVTNTMLVPVFFSRIKYERSGRAA